MKQKYSQNATVNKTQTLFLLSSGLSPAVLLFITGYCRPNSAAFDVRFDALMNLQWDKQIRGGMAKTHSLPRAPIDRLFIQMCQNGALDSSQNVGWPAKLAGAREVSASGHKCPYHMAPSGPSGGTHHSALPDLYTWRPSAALEDLGGS